jgi:hypothetical protein
MNIQHVGNIGSSTRGILCKQLRIFDLDKLRFLDATPNQRYIISAIQIQPRQSPAMSISFELWKTVYELLTLEFVDAELVDRVYQPKIEASNFRGKAFVCLGKSVLFQRKNHGADFRLLMDSGEGGVHQLQPSSKVFVLQKPPPLLFVLPGKQQHSGK